MPITEALPLEQSVEGKQEEPIAKKIVPGGRRTQELVFGFVGPVYSGVTTTARSLGGMLVKKYKYEVNYIKISTILKEKGNSDTDAKGIKYFNVLQDKGNALRQKYGPSYLAEKAVESIAVKRGEEGGYKEKDGELTPRAKDKRWVHIIDSIKHPAEVELLRDVYGDLFWLVGVFAPEQKRKDRAQRADIPTKEIDTLFERDEAEDLDDGQQVRKTIKAADFFVRNDASNRERLSITLARFLDILFDTKTYTPTFDEMAMHTAASAACHSACLSRQVGASIFSGSGEHLGVGKNDPPKFMGGLYCDDDEQEDHRCHKWEERECHNDRYKNKLLRELSEAQKSAFESALKKLAAEKRIILKENSLDLTDYFAKKTMDNLARSRIKDLIEFSRAVHAEMEAILSVTRAGKNGIVGAKMYCTTYPCHNCARHIVAAGIRQVYYIEPYPKSLATDLHPDAISIDGKAPESRVQFVQFEGVAPKNVMKLFLSSSDRKIEGKARKVDPRTARPIFCPPLDAYSQYEKIVLKNLKDKEEDLGASRTTW